MKTIISLTSAALISSASAAVIQLSTDTANPGPAFGSSFGGTLDDPFAYDETDPTSVNPAVVLSGTNGYHGTGGGNVVLQYTLTNGIYTVSSGEQIVMDLWGRDSSAFNESRDDDFDVTLYLGDYSTTVTSVTNQAIDGDHHARISFSGLTAGQQFDRVEITARNSSGEGNNNFVLMETRLASIPEPSSTALLGLAGLGLLMRRRR